MLPDLSRVALALKEQVGHPEMLLDVQLVLETQVASVIGENLLSTEVFSGVRSQSVVHALVTS